MKTAVETYTTVIPWYERDDFERLSMLSNDREGIPLDYEHWRSNALFEIYAWLGRGRALQLVTVRPGPFINWLLLRDLPNTAEVRRRYVAELAIRHWDA